MRVMIASTLSRVLIFGCSPLIQHGLRSTQRQVNKQLAHEEAYEEGCRRKHTVQQTEEVSNSY